MIDETTPQQAIEEVEAIQGKNISEYPDSRFNPLKNPDVICIMKQQDGNWKAWGQRVGKLVEKRGVKPEDCLLEFLTQG